jgi:hypothetical protein
LIQRLGGADAAESGASPSARRAAEIVGEIRRAAFGKWVPEDEIALRVEPELGAGCRAHALYLARHPKQLEAWPDAHEEYPDQEGFSALGAGAGSRSVIAPGTSNEQEAIDGWMATFYHRLPLTSPGLIGIGWGHEAGIAVLDCASLWASWVAPGRVVVWPVDGATDVPLRFQPELPNPVPGADQSEWGYPITLQSLLSDQSLTMSLHVGTEDGAEVECHLSTPWKPTNERLAPVDAACLIPKRPLKPSTTYTVVALNLAEGAREVWSFRTAKR